MVLSVSQTLPFHLILKQNETGQFAASVIEGIMTIPIEQAIAALDSWQTQLRELAIANDLRELKEKLQHSV